MPKTPNPCKRCTGGCSARPSKASNASVTVANRVYMVSMVSHTDVPLQVQFKRLSKRSQQLLHPALCATRNSTANLALSTAQKITRCSPQTRMHSRRTCCETTYLNSLNFSPVAVPVHCRLWNAEESGVQSVECGVWSVK